ncbi:MAG TPA: hypothetical protein VN678_05470, partial [Acidobacteriaceae bacterium]|nr:hypothetical protein [Acidobacteriaceae bacterium]
MSSGWQTAKGLRRLRLPVAIACALISGFAIPVRAQEAPATAPSAVELKQKIDAISAALAATQQQIEQSQQQMRQLQQQLDELKEQMGAAAAAAPAAAAGVSTPTTAEAQAGSLEPAKVSIEERQETTEAAVKVLDQVKVESASKYPVRVTGLILFNGFLNHGAPDNV